MKRLAIIAVLAAALLLDPSAQAGAKTASPRPSTARLAPPVACTSANRMDIFVDEDNILWECECQMLKTGNLCAWQVIGGVDAVDIRKRVKARFHLVPRLRVLVLA